MMWIQNAHLLSHHLHQSFHTSYYNFNYNHNNRKKNYIICFASYKRIVVEGTPLLTQIGGVVKKHQIEELFHWRLHAILVSLVMNNMKHKALSCKKFTIRYIYIVKNIFFFTYHASYMVHWGC